MEEHFASFVKCRLSILSDFVIFLDHHDPRLWCLSIQVQWLIFTSYTEMYRKSLIGLLENVFQA